MSDDVSGKKMLYFF